MKYKKKCPFTVFLDVDGVLNTTKDWKAPFTLNPKNIKSFGEYARGSRVVLISSWRAGYDTGGKHAAYVTALIQAFMGYDIHIVGCTGYSPEKDRAAEIRHYLKWHDIGEYVILDDDLSEYKTPVDNLWLIDAEKGFI